MPLISDHECVDPRWGSLDIFTFHVCLAVHIMRQPDFVLTSSKEKQSHV